MRKIKPAIRGALAAALVMGVGTGVIAGTDFMLHGAIPMADAATRVRTDAVVTESHATDDEGHAAVLLTASNQFKTDGTVTISTNANGHTGPFSVSFAVPGNWTARGGTFAQFSIMPTSSNPAGSATVSLSSDKKTGTLKVTGAGIEDDQRIVIQYQILTSEQTFNESGDDPDAEKLAVRNELDSVALVRNGPEYQTDWSQPDFEISITPGATSSSPYAIVPGTEYADGIVTVQFKENCAGVKMGALDFSSANWSSAFSPTLDTAWTVTRGSNAPSSVTSGSLNVGSKADFYKGDTATIRYKLRVKETAFLAMMGGATAKVGTSVEVTGSHDGVTDASMEARSVSASFKVSSVSLAVGNVTSTNVTSPGQEVTIGDQIKVSVPVTAAGFIANGSLRFAIMNGDLNNAIKIKDVTNVSSDAYQIGANGRYVDIKLNPIPGGSTTTYDIVVECGHPESAAVALLDGKTLKFNADVAILGSDLPTIDVLSSGTPKHEVEVAAPKAEISTKATDPNVQIQDPDGAYQTAIVTNLGDTARFRVTFTNKSNRTIKGVVISDALTVSRDGTSINNATACVDILKDSVSLTKGNESIDANTVLSQSGQSTAEHPDQIQVTPKNSLNLKAGESVVLQYDVKMGHTEISTSNKNTRGATVTNSPEMRATNFSDKSVTDTATASVTVATAELSADLSVTKDKVPVGEKTTYVLTVQSVEQKTTTFSDEYAFGLHVTSMLDETARSRGYKHDISSLKLYHVAGGKVDKEIPATDYKVQWGESSNGVKEAQFTLDLNADKARTYRIKNVVPSQVSTTKDNSGSSASGESTVSAEATTSAGTVLSEATAATEDRGDDVDTIAADIKEGFIITYDGITKDMASGFAGELKTTTDTLVHADNAGYAVDREPVTIVGETMIIPETNVDFDLSNGGNTPENQSANGQAGTNGNGTGSRNGQYAPLISTDVGFPMSFVTLVAGLAGWGYTRYRKIRRR